MIRCTQYYLPMNSVFIIRTSILFIEFHSIRIVNYAYVQWNKQWENQKQAKQANKTKIQILITSESIDEHF